MNDFITISKYSGMRLDLVQAGGGNSSVKLDDKHMLIKASGIHMADINKDTGYSVVSYPMIVEYLKNIINNTSCDDSDILTKALVKGNKPSIETFLHTVTDKVTLHTHPILVNILATRTNGMDQLKNLFPESLCIDYATPGIMLAKEYYSAFQKAIPENKSIKIIFLKNHGLIVTGKTAEEVINLTEKILYTIENFLQLDHSSYRNAYKIYQHLQQCELFADQLVVKAENNTLLNAFKSFDYKLWDYQFCPDCLVYCGKKPLYYTPQLTHTDLKKFLEAHGEPRIIIYGKHLYIRAVSLRKAKEIEDVLTFSAHVAMHNNNESIDYLSVQEQNFLLNWEDEKYRQKL